MISRFVKIAAVAGVVLAGIGFLLLPRQEAAVCLPEDIGLQASAPLELAALLNEDCMRAYAREAPDRLPDALLDFGYPTLLLETEPRVDVLALFVGAVTSGQRSFFANDRAILGRLADMRQSAQIEEISDFVAASQPETHAAYTPYDMERFLRFLPVWQNPEGQARLIDHCKEFDCAESRTVCPGALALSDKLALVSGDQTLIDIIGLCPVGADWQADAAWITTLRKAGVVDTTCAISTQVNAALNDGLSLEEPCFTQDRQIGDYAGYASGDVATFLKRKVQTGMPEVINAASLEIMFQFSPAITEYIATQ